jgi:hypothetical protein
MPRPVWISFIAFVAGFIFVSGVSAAIIVDNTITGSVVNTFEGMAIGNVDGLVGQSGAQYGERFSGQVLSTVGNFDVLTGSPSSPLTLLPGEAALNLYFLAFNSVALAGCGPATCPIDNAVGEGAVSILLDSPTDVFGFDVVGAHGGTANASFFDVSGALLASFTFNDLTDSFFGFRDTSGSSIAGVSLTNLDFDGGIGIDNVTFNIGLGQPIPEPAGLALLAIGLVGLRFSRRR